MVSPGEVSAIPTGDSAIPAIPPIGAEEPARKLTKKEQKKLEKERLKQQKKEAERQKKLEKQKKLSSAKTTPVNEPPPAKGSAIPKITSSVLVPPPPPPPLDFGRDRSQTISAKKAPGKALTMADEIASRRTEPLPKKSKPVK